MTPKHTLCKICGSIISGDANSGEIDMYAINVRIYLDSADYSHFANVNGMFLDG